MLTGKPDDGVHQLSESVPQPTSSVGFSGQHNHQRRPKGCGRNDNQPDADRHHRPELTQQGKSGHEQHRKRRGGRGGRSDDRSTGVSKRHRKRRGFVITRQEVMTERRASMDGRVDTESDQYRRESDGDGTDPAAGHAEQGRRPGETCREGGEGGKRNGDSREDRRDQEPAAGRGDGEGPYQIRSNNPLVVSGIQWPSDGPNTELNPELLSSTGSEN